jgi:hypothetical protein
MVRKHTPEELAEAERILKEAEPLFKEREIREQAEKERWVKEIAMLERRVKEDHVDIDLGHGDTLAVRTCLSDEESGRLGDLYKTWFTPLKKPDKNAIAKRKEVSYEIIELVTANPAITKDWLKSNPDKFATDDMVNAIFTWAELRQKRENERAQRLVSAVLFRQEPEGAGIRELPAETGDTRPERVGGPPR